MLTALAGTFVNSLAVIAGGGAGTLLGARFPERLRQAALSAVGLAVVWIGLGMALKADASGLVVVASLAVGATLGEWLDIERRLEKWTRRAEGLGAGAAHALVVSSVIFCVGPLSILGALQDGLLGQSSILLAKAVLDGATALVLASTMGAGVVLAAGTILLYQGSIALMASVLRPALTGPALAALSGVGGLLILAIGLNMCGGTRFKTANLLPAIVLATAAAAIAGARGYTIP